MREGVHVELQQSVLEGQQVPRELGLYADDALAEVLGGEERVKVD